MPDNHTNIKETARRKGPPIKDISGLIFGHLTILQPSGERDSTGYIKWICRCDCGTLVNRTHASLNKGGKNTSCGCMKGEIGKENLHSRSEGTKPNSSKNKGNGREYPTAHLTGLRFGLLEVLGPSEQRERSAVKWECRCDCGNIVYRSHRILKASADNASCGCLIPQIRSQSFRKADKITEGTNVALLESTKLRSDNKSGFRGVFYNKQRGKWRAEICFKGKNHHVGMFDTLEEAVIARMEAQEKIHQPVIDKYYANTTANSRADAND